MNENPTAGGQSAQPQYSTSQPREMTLTPRGQATSRMSRRFPRVIGGTCEFCGVQDPNYPGDVQYKFCEHYRAMELRCVYCPLDRDQDDVVRSSQLNVAEHPDRPGQLVVWCRSYECSKKHQEAFK